MTAAAPAPIAAAEATRLFERLRTSFLAVETALADIIAARAWEPLGYDSLAAAWADRMADVKLPAAASAYVAYALMDAGASPDEVADVMHGVGPKTARELANARAAGLDATAAAVRAARATRAPRLAEGKTTVRAHTRSAPTRRNSVTVQGFTDDEISRWKIAAGELGIDFPTWCRDLLRDALNAEVGADA